MNKSIILKKNSIIYNYQSQEMNIDKILLVNLYTLFKFWQFSHLYPFSDPGFHIAFSPPWSPLVWDSFSVSWP